MEGESSSFPSRSWLMAYSIRLIASSSLQGCREVENSKNHEIWNWLRWCRGYSNPQRAEEQEVSWIYWSLISESFNLSQILCKLEVVAASAWYKMEWAIFFRENEAFRNSIAQFSKRNAGSTASCYNLIFVSQVIALGLFWIWLIRIWVTVLSWLFQSSVKNVVKFSWGFSATRLFGCLPQTFNFSIF